VIAAILIPAVLLLVRVASPSLNAHDLGAIVGPVQNEWWRYLVAPFVYPDIGYLFVACVGIAIFGAAVEQRLGTIATAVLIVACGALSMLAADGIETVFASGNDILLAAGGNGIALGLLSAWAVMRAAEVRAHPDEDVELIGAAVAAAVLILLPLVDDYANVFAGLAGALVGAGCGLAAALARRERHPG
jgi:membrane associated rhomboid family serine protease